MEMTGLQKTWTIILSVAFVSAAAGNIFSKEKSEGRALTPEENVAQTRTSAELRLAQTRASALDDCQRKAELWRYNSLQVQEKAQLIEACGASVVTALGSANTQSFQVKQ